MSDDLLRPPPVPFYAEKPKRKRRGVIVNQRKEYWDRKRKELEEELAKPVEKRVGKLRTLQSGDFTKEELVELTRRRNARRKG
jgi:hypothetical protein